MGERIGNKDLLLASCKRPFRILIVIEMDALVTPGVFIVRGEAVNIVYEPHRPHQEIELHSNKQQHDRANSSCEQDAGSGSGPTEHEGEAPDDIRAT